jgi:hypothetical protein
MIKQADLDKLMKRVDFVPQAIIACDIFELASVSILIQ